MLDPGAVQNPWAAPSGTGGGGAGFHNLHNRSMIADLALAALKEKGQDKRRFHFKIPTFNPDRSLFFLKKSNPLRRHCLNIVDSSTGYNTAWIILILLFDKLVHVLEYMENVFVYVFTVETVLKIIAYGLVLHPTAYLKNFWNILDFAIVVTGLLDYAMQSFKMNVKAMRAFRVLRPLRLVSGMPSLQVVLNSILMALVPLLHIGLLVLFVIILYAILGLELFNGKLHKTCYHNFTSEGINFYKMMSDPRPCTEEASSIGFKCSGLKTGYICMDSIKDKNLLQQPERYIGPQYGYVSFDNIFYSMLTVFVCITMEGWTDTAYYITDSVGSWWPWLYFVSMILLGSFFVMNLVLGVLSGEFSKEKEKIDRKELFQKQRQERRDQQDYNGYKEWIEFADELSDSESDDESAESGDSMMSQSLMEADLDPSEMNIEDLAKTKFHATFRRLKKFRKRLKRTVNAFLNSRECFVLILLLVFLNTAVLVSEHHGQPEWLDDFQNTANILFVTLFTLEMLIKMAAQGPMNYFSKIFNRLDFVIVVLSLLELILNRVKLMDPLGLSVLRCARLLRIFKFTQFWGSLRSLVTKLLKSVKSIASLLLLLFLFILIFSLLGMQLFGGRFNFENREKPRANFDGAIQAMLTVFQILTGEDWNTVMYNGMLAYSRFNIFFQAMVIIYFIALFVCGNYILLNVFLAIAVDNLNDDDDDEEEAGGDKSGEAGGGEELDGGEPEKKSAMDHIKPKETKIDYTNFQSQTYEQMFAENEIEVDPLEAAKEQAAKEAAKSNKTIPPYISFFLFSDTNKFRVFCHNLVCSSYFNNMILLSILISSALLAAEDPVNPESQMNRTLEIFDLIFTAIFTIEICLKMIAYGALLHPGCFCRNAFNMLDLFVVVIALVSALMVNRDSSISAIKILRVIRVLRPLRAINRAKGLKHVVQCVIVAVKSIGNIILVTFLLMFMFAVIGVQLFKGRFNYCNDKSRLLEKTCNGNFTDEDDKIVSREWNQPDFNFDNVGHALLTLFATSTFEGWPLFLTMAIDSVQKENHGPQLNNRRYLALFFILYIIVIAFFMVNIFVGFVIVTFQREGEAEYRNCELNKNQRKCIEYALKARPIRRYIPKGHLQYKIWSIVVSKKFETLISLAILINTILLACKHDNQSIEFNHVTEGINHFFTAAFTLEMILKLCAYSFRHYVSDPWNIMDAFIVFGSLIEIVMLIVQNANNKEPSNNDQKNSVNIAFMRLFRVMRLVKLLNREESIRKLLWTFVKSIRALPYVAMLIALIFFIYAVIGMQQFGRIEYAWNPTENSERPVINEHNNFKNFFYAILVLFRSSTGEAWQDIMMSARNSPKVKCIDKSKLENSCGNWITYPYFISFYIMCSFLIINLFVAVIMDNFDYLTRDWSILGPHHLDEFVTKWAEYDPDAKGRVRHLDVVTMLGKINPPLGFGSMCPHTRACHVSHLLSDAPVQVSWSRDSGELKPQKLVRMNMPLQSDGTVFFNATLFALVRRNLKIKVPDDGKDKDKSLDQLNEELRGVIKKIWKRTSPKLLDQIIPPKNSDVVTVGKFYATFLIQNWFRDWQKRRMVQKDTRFIPQILAGERSMPHQPTIVGFPRRCSSDLTGDEIQRTGVPTKDTGGLFGRTLAEWTKRRTSKKVAEKNKASERQAMLSLGLTNVMNGTIGPKPFTIANDAQYFTPSNYVPQNGPHPAVIALAANEMANKKAFDKAAFVPNNEKPVVSVCPAVDAEAQDEAPPGLGSNIMNFIRNSVSGPPVEHNPNRLSDEAEMEMARNMFAAARRQSRLHPEDGDFM
ncbi:Voltage-dependent L-type calcium channel subunit alpha-1C [Cichlidogyrus casuarinus]|uniref:Voltage-dependent L-type calcium channel subunit alpha-1C n=1 Tax=Cichlidogyrus casuarinus TaxID=1844966 RepID=A0ABD2QR14_9PLAT